MSDELKPITVAKKKEHQDHYSDLCESKQAELDYFKSRRENP